MRDLDLVVRVAEAHERCFGCKNVYRLADLVPRDGLLLCRRYCATRCEVFPGPSTTIEVIG